MSRSRWFRLFPLLAVLFLLSSPLLAAGGHPSQQDRMPDLASSIWQFLGRLLPSLETSRGTMDPNGQPSDSSVTDSSADGDSHGTMDPNG